MVLGFIVEGGQVAVSVKGEMSVRARKGLGRGLSEWQLLRAGWELLCESDGDSGLKSGQDGRTDLVHLATQPRQTFRKHPSS
jgi:hypothetical protein